MSETNETQDASFQSMYLDYILHEVKIFDLVWEYYEEPWVHNYKKEMLCLKDRSLVKAMSDQAKKYNILKVDIQNAVFEVAYGNSCSIRFPWEFESQDIKTFIDTNKVKVDFSYLQKQAIAINKKLLLYEINVQEKDEEHREM